MTEFILYKYCKKNKNDQPHTFCLITVSSIHIYTRTQVSNKVHPTMFPVINIYDSTRSILCSEQWQFSTPSFTLYNVTNVFFL